MVDRKLLAPSLYIAPSLLLFQNASEDQGEYCRIMQENRRALELARDAQGRRFSRVALPSPHVKECVGAKRYCDCDADYTLVTGAVIATAFVAAEDHAAHGVFQHAFPWRKIALLPGATLSIGATLHCSTQQLPAVSAHSTHKKENHDCKNPHRRRHPDGLGQLAL